MIEERYGIELVRELPAGESGNWEDGVRAELARIAHARTGQIVLNTLRWYVEQGQATLRIWPWTGQDQNANTSSWDEELPRAVHIQYSPSTWRAGEADEILLHELVHAVRHASGRRAKCTREAGCRFAGALFSFSNREEFLAVLVENIYRSDPGRIGRRMPLRGSHASMQPMERSLADSLRFFAAGNQVFHLVSEFRRDHPVLFQLLARVPSRFNPLAAFEKDRQRAFELSLGTNRDAARYEEAFFDELAIERMLRPPVDPLQPRSP